jgi:DNA helicase-2/ATP-dependent DNA helicase PcrA
MAEERRLFYVGLTRAKDRLYLVRAEQRSGYGAPDWSSPSRFLDDIPASLVTRKGISERSGKPARKTEYFTTWTLDRNRNAQSVKEVEMKFKAGMRVKNENWGEGLVVDARLQDGEERIDVFFDSVGFKRLIASMAKLEIVGHSK